MSQAKVGSRVKVRCDEAVTGASDATTTTTIQRWRSGVLTRVAATNADIRYEDGTVESTLWPDSSVVVLQAAASGPNDAESGFDGAAAEAETAAATEEAGTAGEAAPVTTKPVLMIGSASRQAADEAGAATAEAAEDDKAVEGGETAEGGNDDDKEAEWRVEGSEYLGRRVRRSVFTDNGLIEGFSHGTVVGWLDAHESDYTSAYNDGAPAALFHVAFDEGPLAGDEEDLEECELLQSLPSPGTTEFAPAPAPLSAGAPAAAEVDNDADNDANTANTEVADAALTIPTYGARAHKAATTAADTATTPLAEPASARSAGKEPHATDRETEVRPGVPWQRLASRPALDSEDDAAAFAAAAAAATAFAALDELNDTAGVGATGTEEVPAGVTFGSGLGGARWLGGTDPPGSPQHVEGKEGESGGGRGAAAGRSPAAPTERSRAFKRAVKKRFARDPETYKAFLELLHAYRKGQRGVGDIFRQISRLFADHPDLIHEFRCASLDLVVRSACRRLSVRCQSVVAVPSPCRRRSSVFVIARLGGCCILARLPPFCSSNTHCLHDRRVCCLPMIDARARLPHRRRLPPRRRPRAAASSRAALRCSSRRKSTSAARTVRSSPRQ